MIEIDFRGSTRIWWVLFQVYLILYFFVGFVSVVAVYPPSPATTKVTILQMDLETVYDGNELNDPIVDFFMM